MVRGERESKFVTFDRTRAELEILWNIVVLQPCRIEPFFQGFRLPGVSEDVAKPHPTQRRHFVECKRIGMRSF